MAVCVDARRELGYGGLGGEVAGVDCAFAGEGEDGVVGCFVGFVALGGGVSRVLEGLGIWLGVNG